VNVRLLGPLEVRLGDGPVELGPRKQRAVLAMLALEPGRTVSADRLAEGLWGDELPPSAAKMVQHYVSHLRRVLAGDGVRIVTHGRGYELQLPERDVDAVRFERLVDESCPRDALALWQGDALADLTDEPFAASEIRRLEELRVRAAECAIDADLEAGRHAEVIGELDALAAAHPLREHLHAQRMLALYRSGRQSEALEAYRDARRALIDEVGVEPGAELQRLHDAMLGHDPALDLRDAEPPGVAPDTASPARPLLIGAAAVLIAGILAFGVIRVLGPESLPGIDENHVGLIDPDSGRITKQIAVGRTPGAVTDGGGSTWIASAAEGTVTRVDRASNEAVRIAVGGAPAALAFAAGSLWVADSDSRALLQIDPGADKVVGRIPVGNAPRALAVTPGAVWVASGVDGRIRRVDLRSARVTRTIPVGANPSGIAAGAGSVWVASEEDGTVTRVEPRTGGKLPIRVGNGPSAVAFGEGAVWVANRGDGTLSKLDPARNRVEGTVAIGADPTAVAVGEGSVWVAGGEEGTVAQVDPAGPHVVKRLKTGSSPSGLAVAGGSVWAAADAPQSAHRGGTLRVFLPRDSGAAVPVDWLDPLSYTNIVSQQVSSLAYDGLVAYRRVDGAAGATLVGALATTVPEPTDDGLTYLFSLRPGVRYSDGTAVRPTDFRASVERFLQATRGFSSQEALPPLFDGIVGARRCSTDRCDLSRGIETDDAARTITIHLTRPDSDQLNKLTMQFAYVVPAGSPARATEGLPPPGTGPYRIVAWDGHRGGALVRNRYFRSSATRWRAEGFADRIEVRLHGLNAIERPIAAVERGSADLAVLANPWKALVPAARLRALLTRWPGQVHSRPAATTDWIFLNTQSRPFDDPRAREAVNFAIDRARVVELAGGPAVGELTCQVLPSGFPGYAPYCPYTASPAKSGVWTAPDMAQARRLVSASGRMGARVIVRVPSFREKVGRYYANVLEQLGFRTDVRILGFKEDDTWDSRANAQTGFVGWAADTLGASNFIEPLFTCAGRGTLNLSRLCDPALERLVRQARTATPADAVGAWRAADHRLTDLAATVPLTRRRSVVLVSKRVGNVRNHPQLFTLLDQMWVR
jgi:peptide/nickel transport system substrate-binding protein